MAYSKDQGVGAGASLAKILEVAAIEIDPLINQYKILEPGQRQPVKIAEDIKTVLLKHSLAYYQHVSLRANAPVARRPQDGAWVGRDGGGWQADGHSRLGFRR